MVGVGDGWDGGTGSDGGWMALVLEGIRRVGLMVDGLVEEVW